MQARDPIPQFKKWVLEEKILSEQQIADIEKDVEAVVEDAVQFAEESPKPVSSDATSNHFAEFSISRNEG